MLDIGVNNLIGFRIHVAIHILPCGILVCQLTQLKPSARCSQSPRQAVDLRFEICRKRKLFVFFQNMIFLKIIFKFCDNIVEIT